MAQSYNGWPASPDPAAIQVDRGFVVCGVQFPGGVKSGDVATVLGYVAEQIHRRVEQLVEGWCWGYEYRQNVNNPATLSCHSSGTAIDVNAPEHPNGGERYGGFSDAQVAEVYTILEEVDNTVTWGADFTKTYDPMHFEIDATPEHLAAAAGRIAQEGQDMPLNADDKAWIQTAMRDQLDDFFRREHHVVTNDRACTPNDFPYSYESALERIIRLTSATFVGESGAPH